MHNLNTVGSLPFQRMISAHSLQRDTKKVMQAEQRRKRNQMETKVKKIQKRQQTTAAVWDGRLDRAPSISIGNEGKWVCRQTIIVQFLLKV